MRFWEEEPARAKALRQEENVLFQEPERIMIMMFEGRATVPVGQGPDQGLAHSKCW